MKKIGIIGAILLSITAVNAATNLTCGVFKGAAMGKPATKIVIDLDQDQVFKSIFISSTQTFSVTKGNESLTLGFSESEGTSKTILTESIVRNMESGDSIGLSSLRVNDQEKTNTAVCYLTGRSDVAPFDM
jgi:hypothetical protein